MIFIITWVKDCFNTAHFFEIQNNVRFRPEYTLYLGLQPSQLTGKKWSIN